MTGFVVGQVVEVLLLWVLIFAAMLALVLVCLAVFAFLLGYFDGFVGWRNPVWALMDWSREKGERLRSRRESSRRTDGRSG